MTEKLYEAHKQSGLLLNANENPNNLDQIVLEELTRSLKDMELNRYPADGSASLRQAYANWLGVSSEMVMAGNGSDQMLQVLITAFADEKHPLLTLNPDFGMYDFYANLNHAPVVKFDLSKDGSLDLDAFIEKAKEVRPGLILFSNPNNPFGSLVRPQEVERLLQQLENTPVVMDEAYMEFAGQSAVDLLEKYSNLYVTRTLSKVFGLAGCRVGFLISNAENIRKMDAFRPVYNLNTFSCMAGQAVLRHADLYEAYVDQVCSQREIMQAQIEEMKGIDFYPSHANFICLFLKNKQKLLDLFERENIQIRNYPDRDYIRITIGNPEDNEKVLKILRNYNEEFV